MASHQLSPAALLKLEADRMALMALHAALPALKAAAQAAHGAVDAAEAQVARLLNDVAHAGFHGLDVHDVPAKMHASENEAKAAAVTPRARAVDAAKASGLDKLATKPKS